MPTTRKANAPSKADIQKARNAYDHANRRKKKLKRMYVNAKVDARKAKNLVKRLVDRRKKSRGKHQLAKVCDGICGWAKWGVSVAASIHYAQTRPFLKYLGKGNTRTLPMYTDCSGSSTIAANEAGAEDPNGYGYNGYGYTGTFLSHAQANDLIVSRDNAKAGFFCVFGSAPGTHVVILMEDAKGRDPVCASHGQESGPSYYPLSVEAAAHSGQPLTFIKPDISK